MESAYEKYKSECEKIRNINKEYLKIFEDNLVSKGLSKKTIKNHVENIDLMINDFALREDPSPMEEAIHNTEMFFDFFINKCLYSSPSSVKGMVASLKKFAKCMHEHGKIDKADYDILVADIKEGLPYWIEECEDYSDGIF